MTAAIVVMDMEGDGYCGPSSSSATTKAPGAKDSRRNRDRRRERKVSAVATSAVATSTAASTGSADGVEERAQGPQLKMHRPMTPSQILTAERAIVCSWASRLCLRTAKQKRISVTAPLFLESTTHESVLLSLLLTETLKSPRNRSLEKTVQECYDRCGEDDEGRAREERDNAVDELRGLVPADQEVVMCHLLSGTTIPLHHIKTIFSYTITRRSDMVPDSLREFHNAGLQKVPSQSPGVVSNIVEPDLLKDYQTLGSLQVSRPRLFSAKHFLARQLPVFGAAPVDRGGLEQCKASQATCRDNDGDTVELYFASPGSALAFQTLYVDPRTGFVPAVVTPDTTEQLAQDLTTIFGETPTVLHTDDLGFEKGAKGRIPGSRSADFQGKMERQVRDRLDKVIRDRRILSQHMAEGTRHVIALNLHGQLTLDIISYCYAASKVFQTMLLMRSKAVAKNDPSLVLVLTDPFISMDDLDVGPEERCTGLEFDGLVTTGYAKAMDGIVRWLWKGVGK